VEAVIAEALPDFSVPLRRSYQIAYAARRSEVDLLSAY
jgi:hypothetical protein